MCSYEIKEYRTAKRFLDYLQIRQGHWLPKGEWTSPWVFRGHGNADLWILATQVWRRPLNCRKDNQGGREGAANHWSAAAGIPFP